jgi:hypothetical protein
MIKDNNDGTFSIVAPCSFDIQKPVAYVVGNNQYALVIKDTVLKVGAPLYTAPIELSDDEIITKYRELILKSSI